MKSFSSRQWAPRASSRSTGPQARNALTRAVLTQARRALDEASSDPAIRCVVLCGAEGHFCSGADLRQNLMDDPELMDHLDVYMDDFHGLVKSVVRCEKPTIAMMDGGAVGFGADLAFACDLRVASTRAYAQEKFVKIGLMPDGGGTFWLPRLVGTARAMQMILLADKVEAEELHRLGVVAKVVAARGPSRGDAGDRATDRGGAAARLRGGEARDLRELGFVRGRAPPRADRAAQAAPERRLASRASPPGCRSASRTSAGSSSTQKRYRSPVSHRTVTTMPRAISAATSHAAWTLAPEEGPTNNPSSRASRLAI